MATTQNGIYYQDDYTKNADILADMKEMAESVDEVIEKEKETTEQTIQEIQSNQTAQNKKIEQLDDNQIHVTTEKASNINVQDASGQNGKIKLFGVSKQEGTPSPENVVEIQNTTGDIEITDCNENLVLNGYSTPKTDESFWNATSSRFEPLKDGWGKYVLNNTSSATQYINSFINFSKFKNIIKANTQYKLLVEIRNVSMSQTTERDFFCVAGATSSEAFLTYFQISQFETAKFEKIITSKANFDNTALLLRSFLSVSANNNVSLEIRISLLEANSTETEIKIGNQEYIFPLAQNQKMYEGSYTADDGIHHKRKQFNLSSLTNVSDWTNKGLNENGTYTYFTRATNLMDYKFVADLQAICSHFEYFGTVSGTSAMQNKGVGCAFYYTNYNDKLFYINTTIATTEKLVAWLSAQETANTPVILEYETEEETIEEYTEEQQTQRDQLQNAKTYKTVTNVFTDNAEVEMNYIADTKTYVDNEINSIKNQLNTINELLSTTTTSAMLLDNMQSDLESEVT